MFTKSSPPGQTVVIKNFHEWSLKEQAVNIGGVIIGRVIDDVVDVIYQQCLQNIWVEIN